MPARKFNFGLYRCQWQIAGRSCNALITDESAYHVFHQDRELVVCSTHRKLKQALALLDASLIPPTPKTGNSR